MAASQPQSTSYAAPASGDGPALWVIRDADSTIYLFGTVHVLRAATVWETPRITTAFDASTDVWFEVDDAAGTLPSLLAEHGLSSGRPLAGSLSPAERRALAAAASRAGTTEVELETLRPWLAGMAVGNAPMLAAGYDPAFGVETMLRERAVVGGKPVRALETMDDQVRYLAALPEATQLDLLRYMIREPDVVVADLDASVGAWVVGDLAGVEPTLALPMRKDSEALYQAMMARRSVLLADRLQSILEGSGVAFVGLGAAHLAGEDSVQEILEGRGVDVELAR